VFSSLVEDDERREGPAPRGRTVASRAIHLNNLAWADLMLADPGLVAEANAASARAIELLPGPSAIWGTRALALIATSHFAEGIAMAQKAFKKAGPDEPGAAGVRGGDRLREELAIQRVPAPQAEECRVRRPARSRYNRHRIDRQPIPVRVGEPGMTRPPLLIPPAIP
jgi:hypothetical protein